MPRGRAYQRIRLAIGSNHGGVRIAPGREAAMKKNAEFLIISFSSSRKPVEAILQPTHSLVNGRCHMDTLRCT